MKSHQTLPSRKFFIHGLVGKNVQPNEYKKTYNCWRTVPRSALRSVGRLNFLDPLTETTEKGKRQLLII